MPKKQKAKKNIAPTGPAKTIAKLPVREKHVRKVKQIRAEIKPVIGCQVSKLIQGRPDEVLLQKHLDAIDLHRQTYEARIKQAMGQQKKGQASQVHAIPAHKAKVTEAKGEHEATLLMVQQYSNQPGKSDFHLVWGFSSGTGIDQLWATGETPPKQYIIVEAKGPGATLSTNAAKGDQMSKQWVRSSLESVGNSPSSTQDDRDHAKRMLKGMDLGPPPEVYGRVIEALPGGGAKEVGCPDKGIYHKTK
jgi:hypothetical protein